MNPVEENQNIKTEVEAGKGYGEVLGVVIPRNLRKRNETNLKYREFLDFEEEIFGDILSDEDVNEESVEEEVQTKSKKKGRRPKSLLKHDPDETFNKNLKQDNIGKDKIRKKPKAEEVQNILEEKEPEEIITEPIANLSEINEKPVVSNSDMILVIMEICLRANTYGIESNNKTRKFWDEVYEKEEWDNLLKTFKPETLRKYWRIIRDTGRYKRFIELVIEKAENINYTGVKLLPVINALSNFIISNDTEFEEYALQLKNSVIKPAAPAVKKEPVQPGLQKKRKRNENDIQEDILELDKIILVKKTVAENTENLAINENVEDVKMESKPDPEDIHADTDVSGIEGIIKIFKQHFYSRTNEEILSGLLSTSFNIENAYLLLKDLEYYKELIFSDSDDYIIKHMKNSPYFNKLLETKGKEFVEKRIQFLNEKN